MCTEQENLSKKILSCLKAEKVKDKLFVNVLDSTTNFKPYISSLALYQLSFPDLITSEGLNIFLETMPLTKVLVVYDTLCHLLTNLWTNFAFSNLLDKIQIKLLSGDKL